VISIDTNVLVRLLVNDDPGEVGAARALVASAKEDGEPIFVGDPVLCEMEWVLESGYDATRKEIAAAVQGLLDDGAFAFSDRESVVEALRHYRQTPADLSDCLIAACAKRAGARITVTFDRQMRRVPGCMVLTSRSRRL
jgi:predicted nucleic-acid-binding protein